MIASGDELQAQLVAAVAAARLEHPGLVVDDVAFGRHLAALVGSSDIARVHVADALLAFACGQGDAAAIATLRRIHGPDVERALRRADSTALTADELQQRVWVKLLADGAGGAPHILLYGGRGTLQGWIRVVVSRMVVDLLRSKGVTRERAVAPEVLDAIGRTDPDPQFELWRDRYRAEVQAALEDAFAEQDAPCFFGGPPRKRPGADRSSYVVSTRVKASQRAKRRMAISQFEQISAPTSKPSSRQS